MNIYKRFLIEQYNVGIIIKDAKEIIQNGLHKNEIIWMKHKYKDRYFADPFLIKQDEKYYYILVEEFIFWEEKGKISLLKVDKENFELQDKKVVIEEQTHLSFPFCQENSNWVIPESLKSKKCIAYKIDLNTWKILDTRPVVPFGTVDQIVYSKSNGDNLLMTHTEDLPKRKLFIVSLSGEKNGINPGICVTDDIRYTRSAGAMFMRDGKVYRPVQDSEIRYGYQTHILEIKEIDVNKYEFEVRATLNSKENEPFTDSMHTFNAYDEFCIVDGSKDFFRPMKFFYKKCRFIFRMINK